MKCGYRDDDDDDDVAMGPTLAVYFLADFSYCSRRFMAFW